MAVVRNNDFTEGMSGRLGNMLVFRNVRGKTIVSKTPAKPKKQSEQQRENRSKFKKATFYAKRMMMNAEKKAYYTRKANKLNLPNAYTAAITDYMRKPEIKNVQIDKDVIKGFAVKKNFSVQAVSVTLFDKVGNILEQAENIPVATSSGEWVFHPKTILNDLGETNIRVVATDATGQQITAVQML